MAKDFQQFVSEDREINDVQKNVDEVLHELNLEVSDLDPDEIARIKAEAEEALADAIAAIAKANAAAGAAAAAQATADAIAVEYVKDTQASGNNIIVTHQDDSTTTIPVVTTETQSDWNEADTGDAAYIRNKPTTISPAQEAQIVTNTNNIATNTGNIATNTTAIGGNTDEIVINASNISANTTNIATNSSDIDDIETSYVIDITDNGNNTYDATITKAGTQSTVVIEGISAAQAAQITTNQNNITTILSAYLKSVSLVSDVVTITDQDDVTTMFNALPFS